MNGYSGRRVPRKGLLEYRHKGRPRIEGVLGRDAAGECAGLFYPDLAANPVQGRHLDYHWNGERVDLYRDASGGKVYRIG